MSALLPPAPLLAAFIATSFVLAVTPGPGVFYIVTRSLAEGRRHGLVSVAGVAVGNLGNALGAALGLAALFAFSAAAFAVVKYAGAAYLIWLGVRALRGSRRAVEAVQPPAAALPRVFRDGLIVALFNPKTALFFAAFLPQFIGAGAAPVQTVLLGALFVVVAATTDTVYALVAGTVAPALGRADGVRSFGRYLSAGAFIGLGLFTAIAGARTAR